MRFGHEIIPENAKIVQIDTDPDELGRNYPTALSIQADAKIALRAIIDGVKKRQPKAGGERRKSASDPASQTSVEERASNRNPPTTV